MASGIAAESQHILLCEILLCLGANKQQSLALADAWQDTAAYGTLNRLNLKPTVFQNILYWWVKHYHATYQNLLLNLLQQQINFESSHPSNSSEHEEKHSGLTQPLLHHPSSSIEIAEKIPLTQLQPCLFSLSELAMHHKQADLSLAIIQLNQGVFRIGPDRPTLAYWAIKNHDEIIFNRLIKSNCALIELTLQQLETVGALNDYEYLFAKLTPQQQTACLRSDPLTTDKSPLNAYQQKIYRSAQFHLTSLFTALSRHQPEDCYRVLNYALHQYDYVALELLIPYFNQKNLFTRAIQNNQADLLLHLMFKTSHYPYELAQQIPQTIHVELKTLLTLLAPEEAFGILQHFIAFGLKNTLRDDRSAQEINQQKACFTALNVNDQTFLNQYARYVNLPIATTDRTPTQVNIPFKLGNKVVLHAMRFGIHLTEKYYDSAINDCNPLLRQLTNTILGPTKIIFDYLDDRSKMRFFSTSKKSYQYQFYNLNQKIKQFLRLLKTELQAQAYWQHRVIFQYITPYTGAILLATLLASLGIFIPCALELTRKKLEADALIQQMSTIIDSSNPPTTCAALLFNDRCDRNYLLNHSTSSCIPWCDELANVNLAIVMLGVFGLAFPAVGILITLGLLSPSLYALCLGISRFDDVALNTFSVNLNHAAEQLFEELNSHAALADTALTTQSTIATIRSTLKTIQSQLQIPNNPIRFFKETTDRITLEEINDDSAPRPTPNTSATFGLGLG